MSKKLNSEQIAVISHHAQVMSDLYSEMALRKEKLHSAQVRLARDILNDGKRVVQAQWGRKAGKTLASCFIAWAYALLNPNVQVWIICPQRKQGGDIYWISGRLQKFGPQKYVLEHNTTGYTVKLKNGSLIKVDGCENYEALRGINPDLVIYDEFQNHSKEFHTEIMAPNLVAKGAALVVIGTPPKRDCFYVEFRQQLLDEIKTGDDTRAYYEFPSEVNPTLDKDELRKIKERYIKAGDEKIWLREHMAQLIWGGEGAVFSSWNRDKHVKSHRTLMSYIERDKDKLRWYTIFDPGSSTCFAVLFAAYNTYTSQLFILDEIYETNSRNTDAISIWKRALKKEHELYPNHTPRTFKRIYDEQANYFQINLSKFYRNDPEFHMSPSIKNKVHGESSKETDCSLIKQIMGQENVLNVSDRCEKFIWETENYVLDDDGRYPRDHDHLNPDCFTYLLKACNYKFVEDVPVEEILQSQTIRSVYGNKKVQKVTDMGEWADNIVESALWINPLDEYWN